MNERIQKLIEEATRHYPATESSGEFWTFDKEKFAQLIAQECANICMEMYAKCAGLPGDGALAKDCAYWIKKDFGVE